jgi:HSP20 family protein
MFIDRCFPIEKMDLLDGDIDKFFSDIFPSQRRPAPAVSSSGKMTAFPALDMVDRGNAIVVAVDLPGIKKDDIVITVEKNTLKLTAEKSSKDEYKDEDFYHLERGRSKIERSVALPVKIDPELIKASLADGVLKITLTKAKELQPKKIKVEAN